MQTGIRKDDSTINVQIMIQCNDGVSNPHVSSEVLEAIFSNIHALIAYMDTNFNFIRVNSAYAKADGREADFFVGKNHFSLYPNSENEAIFRNVIATGHAYSAYARAFKYPGHPERGVSYWDWTLHPVNDAGGTVTGLLLTLIDATERRQFQATGTFWSEIDRRVLRGQETGEILQFICDQVIELFDFQLAWIGRKERDGSVSIRAVAGPGRGYADEVQQIGIRWDDTPQAKGPTGAAIRSGQMQVIKPDNAAQYPWAVAAKRYDVKVVASLPLIHGGEIYGAFTLHSQRSDAFDSAVVAQRLTGVSNRMNVALEMSQDQERLRLMSAALESAGNAIFITDKDGRIQWSNAAFSRLSGYEREEIIGQNPRLLKSGTQPKEYYQMLWKTIQAGKIWSSETTERRKDGSIYTVQQTITPIFDTSGEVSHFISINEDITAQKETAARIQHMAHHDGLTGLPNRALFFDRLSQTLALAQREGRYLALFFIDLDCFKAINDTFGHHVGDQVLIEVAQRLKNCVRKSDTVARLAGDEFTIILSTVSYHKDAGIVAEKLVSALAKPMELDGQAVQVGASIGIACFPEDARTADELIMRADSAMYRAKAQGRNGYCFWADRDEVALSDDDS